MIRATSTVEAPAPPEEKLGVADQSQQEASPEMAKPQPVYRKDYKPTPYLIDQVRARVCACTCKCVRARVPVRRVVCACTCV